ncbi:arylamine N-acetyltransferase [Devosia sp. SD17-2]|jgi:N-hydroxyarylamine O-acetyltransferase|uniref:arylamine N-acetyltransferase family protein n=1 Tax=Devosia sp. SD17-2 TaxID=2976459 RepID=UPI0023D7F4A9|nr:arylamine N-acetyltransferase [Devosia sp. SD17-2]WEJ33353.1 arylamine N-acetyltransferase [Devosia sp. SD17-2]
MPEKVNLKAYFDRIGFAGSIAPTVATLELLHALHPATIPFENLDALMGKQVALDQQSIERKLLAERRGGYCFEHNLLFMRVLAELDYGVRPLLARVIWPHAEDTGASEPSHMLLLVEVNGQNYIADVGFGSLTLTTPLRLRAEADQSTPHQNFRLMGGDPEWTMEVQLGDQWRPLYAFTTANVDEAQLAAVNARMSSDPASPFTGNLLASLSPSGRRLTLRDARFTVRSLDGDKQRTEIATIEEMRAILTNEFGLVLPANEALDAALLALLPEPPPAEAEPEPAAEPQPTPES